MKKVFFTLLAAGFLATGCINDSTDTTATVDQAKEDTQTTENPVAEMSANEQMRTDVNKIETYASENGLDLQKTDEGVYYVITEQGSGGSPTLDSKVKVHYKGYLLDGSEFDSSYKRGQPAEFPLRGVVKGWQVGIPLLEKGGKGTLFIPSQLGYGARAIGSKIPANSVLVFDVELIDFQS